MGLGVNVLKVERLWTRVRAWTKAWVRVRVRVRARVRDRVQVEHWATDMDFSIPKVLVRVGIGLG